MHDSFQTFRNVVYDFYQNHGRHGLPWRRPEQNGSFDSYKILVSEMMLQQTQVPRVVPKYHSFLQRFPTLVTLATARLGDVLIAWQGLGYNRRAKYLWQAAKIAVDETGGILPSATAELIRLPGIGPNTAGAIMAYAFNEPAVFIETNIRTVYIHHFFRTQTSVPDRAILELVEKTLDRTNPRLWYWALMDYGSSLKLSLGNLSRGSNAYAKQSKFTGSLRQLRGKVLRLLAEGPMGQRRILDELADERAEGVLLQLRAEGLIRRNKNRYTLP